MRTAILLLALVAGPALANGVDNMVAQCEEVMRCEMCQVTNGPSPVGATKIISYKDQKTGKYVSERVDAGRYGWFQEPGYDRRPDGTYEMCHRVRTAMKKPDSLEAKLPRLMFRQDWKIGDTYCPKAKPRIGSAVR
jgi:hypothetical protein